MSKKRLRRGKRKKSWYLIWLIFFAFVVGALAFLFVSLPIWKVKDVVVRGCLTLDQEEIVKMANITLDKNIFFVDLESGKDRISKIKAVKKLKIKRMLPNKILIEIVERQGQAVLIFENVSYMIDDDGVILDPSENLQDLPVIVGVKKEWVDAGGLSGDITAGVFGLLEQLQEHINPKSIQIDIKEGDNLVLLLDDVLNVKIGSSDNIEKKIAVLGILLDNLSISLEKVEYIDLQSPQYPAIKPVD